MAGIYNRETLLPVNFVDGVKEFDLGSIDLRKLARERVYNWTIVKPHEQCRPDLISYRIYGNQDLWWILMWINGISDPWHDLMPDTALKYPSMDKIKQAIKYARARGK